MEFLVGFDNLEVFVVVDYYQRDLVDFDNFGNFDNLLLGFHYYLKSQTKFF